MVTGVTRCAVSVSRASMTPELAQPARASVATSVHAVRHVFMWEPSWERAHRLELSPIRRATRVPRAGLVHRVRTPVERDARAHQARGKLGPGTQCPDHAQANRSEAERLRDGVRRHGPAHAPGLASA